MNPPHSNTYDEFVEHFKKTFIDKKKRLKVKALFEELTNKNLLSITKIKDFRQYILNNNYAHKEKTPKDDARFKCSEKEIENIYKKFYKTEDTTTAVKVEDTTTIETSYFIKMNKQLLNMNKQLLNINEHLLDLVNHSQLSLY